MPTRSISLLNAKGRETAFAALNTMAERVGATVEREDPDSREILLYVRLNGAYCMIILDAETCRHDFFSAHWNFDYATRNGRMFRDGFDGHGYRSHHKATTICDTLEAFITALEPRFIWIADGSAFTTETKKA